MPLLALIVPDSSSFPRAEHRGLPAAPGLADQRCIC